MKYKKDVSKAVEEFIVLLERQPSQYLLDIEVDIREFIMLTYEASLVDELDEHGHRAFIAFNEKELVIAFTAPTANALDACRCYLKTLPRKPTSRS